MYMQKTKTPMKEIKGDTDGEIHHVLGRIYIVKMTILLKTIHYQITNANYKIIKIQCNPYQTTNGIFHRTKTNNFTVCMETQKILNSQNNLEKEEQSWRNHAPRPHYTTKLQAAHPHFIPCYLYSQS